MAIIPDRVGSVLDPKSALYLQGSHTTDQIKAVALNLAAAKDPILPETTPEQRMELVEASLESDREVLATPVNPASPRVKADAGYAKGALNRVLASE